MFYTLPWWRHQVETFSGLLVLCAGNSPVTGEFPAQRPVTRSFDVFFDLRLNKWLSKQWWGWWFQTPSRPLWRNCNAFCILCSITCLESSIECAINITKISIQHVITISCAFVFNQERLLGSKHIEIQTLCMSGITVSGPFYFLKFVVVAIIFEMDIPFIFSLRATNSSVRIRRFIIKSAHVPKRRYLC